MEGMSLVIATAMICMLLLHYRQYTQWIVEAVLDVVFVVGDYFIRIVLLVAVLLGLAYGLSWIGTMLTGT